MPHNIKKHTLSLISHFSYLEKTRNKVEKLFQNGDIVRRDIDQVYEGLFLGCITSLEAFIEDCFIGMLVGAIKHKKKYVKPKILFKSYKIARKIVFAGKPYVDWLPYQNTTDRARLFYNKGLPFTMIEEIDKQILSEICYIRNAIAHKSPYSLSKFKDSVIQNRHLIHRDKYPAGYLRGIYRTAPSQTRYENYINSISSIALKLSG